MILHDLRKIIKPLLWVIAIAFIASLFFTYTRMSSRGGGEKPLVSVNGENISYLDFIQAYRNVYNRYIENTGGNISPEIERYLKSQVLSQLVANRLLYHEAKKAGIKVSQEEVNYQVENILRSFGSRENFMRYLQYQRIKYPDLEEDIRRQIAISKLTEIIKNSVVLTDQEVKDYWILENEKIDLAYLFLNPGKYAKDIKVDEKEVKDYYQKHKKEFEVPDKVQVSYILISPDEFKDKVKINEKRLKDYYEEHPDEFEVEEERRASHILISVPPNAGEKVKEETRKKIEEIRNKLKKGASFSELARKYSDDEVSAKKGGDLGFFTYSAMTSNFSKAVFSLKKVGDISDIVETPYGFHIIKLTGIKPAHKKSFKEVKNEIRQKIIQTETDKLAREEIQRAREEIEKGKLTFEKYAKNHPNRVKLSPFFSKYEPVKGLSWEPRFNEVAFSLKVGKISPVLKLSEGYCIMMLKEKKPAYIPSWKEAKDKVMERVSWEKAEKITAQRASDIVKEVRDGKALSSFAKEWEYHTLNSISRNSWIRGISAQDRDRFIKTIFSLPEGKLSDPLLLSDGYYIVKILKRKIPFTQFAKEKDKFYKELLKRKKDEFLSSWFAKVREKAKIVDNTSLFFPTSS